MSDAILLASAACGSVANKVESRWSVSSCRSTFALTSSFEWPTLTVTMPRKNEVLMAVGIPHLLILGAGDDQRLSAVMEDRRKKNSRWARMISSLVTQSRDLRALGML